MTEPTAIALLERAREHLGDFGSGLLTEINAFLADPPARPNCTQLEAENEQLAHALAHVSGAITGNLKPHVAYPGKPFAPIEEGLCIYRACQLLAERVVKMREGREATEVEIQAEIIWFVKCAEKELPVPITQRKEIP